MGFNQSAINQSSRQFIISLHCHLLTHCSVLALNRIRHKGLRQKFSTPQRNTVPQGSTVRLATFKIRGLFGEAVYVRWRRLPCTAMDKLSFTKILLLSVVVFSASVFSKRSAFNELKGKISTCFRLCAEPESPCIGESTFVLVRVKKCWALPCCGLYCKGTTKPRYMSPLKMQWLRMLCQFLLKPEPVFRPSCLNSV